MEKKIEEKHECKYCGATTTQPDSECYKAPTPSLPTDEEKGVTVKLFNNGQWKSGAEIYINGHWVKEIAGTFDEKHTLEALAINEDFLELVKNPPKHTLRTNFSSKKCEGEKVSEWQLCPKCLGEGQVYSIGTCTSPYRICPVCNGSKTLVKPIINPPKQEQQTTK